METITSQTVEAEIQSGKAYIHTSKDVNGRPVIVIRVPKHITGASTTPGTTYVTLGSAEQLPYTDEVFEMAMVYLQLRAVRDKYLAAKHDKLP